MSYMSYSGDPITAYKRTSTLIGYVLQLRSKFILIL